MAHNPSIADMLEAAVYDREREATEALHLELLALVARRR